jgi:hypothetical protein
MMPSLDTRTLASGRPCGLRLMAGLALWTALAACVSGEATGNGQDRFPPTVNLVPAPPPSDSALAFTVSATDNLGLLHVDAVATAPGIATVCDTTFNTAVTTFSQTCTINVPSTVPIGTTVTVLAQSVDGQHNISRVDTLLLVTGGGSASIVRITQPPNNNDTAVVGFSTQISIAGRSSRKVKIIGWTVTGVFPAPGFRDSIIYTSPLKDSLSQDTAISFVGAVPGSAVLTAFMYDSLGTLYISQAVTITVVATAGSNTIPVVNFGITPRVEVTDTIHVTGSDRAGIHVLGYVIRPFPLSAAPPIIVDSVIIVGNVNTAIHTFGMHLPIAVFPTTVLVEAFATNNNGRTDTARFPVGNLGTIRRDTVIVVAGLTRPLPNGGTVADGIYHPPSNRLYLSNIEKNQLEVFDLGDSSFHAPIAVGSRPWGMAARPADHAGNMTDTLIVANSGGTLLSFVDVNPATAHEVYRYALPNILFFTVTSVVGPGGVIVEHRTQHDFSDRPQYVAATCTGAVVCNNVIVAYSTTPTAGQSLPFQNQGTIRYENVTKQASHFFFEQAVGQGVQAAIDTIEIDRFEAGGYGIDSTLVPFVQGPFITGVDTSFFSVTTNTPLIGFRDTTFTRNSGNFVRAAFGEGGAIGGASGQPNARVMTYDESIGMVKTFSDKGHLYVLPTPVFDGGVSRPGDVSDWIANTSTSVSGIAINFDGATSAVRADSTYLFDITLRLQGLLQTSGGNVGLDFHPLNFGVPRPGLTGGTQMMFTSSSQAEIDVWNTNTYQLCLVVPTRDPIIGPVKSALIGGGSTMLVGATKFGVVVVTIPQAQMSAACP